MKTVNSFTIWLECSCPHCDAVNWIYDGYWPDPDMSKLDVDGLECWKCGKESALLEDPACPSAMLYVEEGCTRPKIGTAPHKRKRRT